MGIKNIKVRVVSGMILLTLSAVLLVLANQKNGFAQWYTVTIYNGLVRNIGGFFGLFPFSVAELLLYMVIAAVAFQFVLLIRDTFVKKAGKEGWKRFGSSVFLTASILFFLYAACCGVNYHRNSFAQGAGLKTEDYTTEELAAVCRILTEDVNQLADVVLRDEHGVMILSEDEQVQAVAAMERLANNYPELQGYYPQPKGLLIPWILSVQKVIGIYSPFTIEANYNSGIVDYNIPFTACHELSHLRGFMQEEEANFIAYLACMAFDNEEFRYSGSLLGWIYCTNALYRADMEAWTEIRGELNELVEADLKANSEYWDRYDGQVAEVADKVNDSYLKANGQKDGIKSYGRMVDLMVAYYK